MQWPHTVELWKWEADSKSIDIPCQIWKAATENRQLPPSEFGSLGRDQTKILSFGMRCPLWVYPYMQRLGQVAIVPSPDYPNPFGRDFDAKTNLTSLFITGLSIDAGVLSLALSTLTRLPLGESKISQVDVVNPPITPLPQPPTIKPELRWHWIARADQDTPSNFSASTGYPVSIIVPFKVKLLFEDTILSPISDVTNEGDIPAFIRNRYGLPTDLSQIKFSVVTADDYQWNIWPSDRTFSDSFTGRSGNEINLSLSHTGIDGTEGVLGLDLEAVRGWRWIINIPSPFTRSFNWADFASGAKVVAWHNTEDDRNNKPFWDDAITSEWGDSAFTVSA